MIATATAHVPEYTAEVRGADQAAQSQVLTLAAAPSLTVAREVHLRLAELRADIDELPSCRLGEELDPDVGLDVALRMPARASRRLRGRIKLVRPRVEVTAPTEEDLAHLDLEP